MERWVARARVTRGEPLSNESADSLVKYSLSVIWMRVSSTVKRHNSIHRDPLTIRAFADCNFSRPEQLSVPPSRARPL